MGDQVSDLALTLPLACVMSAPLVVLLAVLALLAEFAGVLAISIGSPRRFDGPMGKSDRAFALGVLALMIWAGARPAAVNGVLALVIALTLWTVLNRLRRALRFCAPPTR